MPEGWRQEFPDIEAKSWCWRELGGHAPLVPPVAPPLHVSCFDLLEFASQIVSIIALTGSILTMLAYIVGSYCL